MSQEQSNVKTDRKYLAVIVDTINALQNDAYVSHMKDQGNPSFNKWRDFGAEILDFYNFLKEHNCDIVQILGREGSGKTVGAWTLDPDKTLYLNADNKELTFPEGYQLYNTEKKNLKIPKTYQDIKDYIKLILDNGKLHPDAKGRLTVFVLAHIEEYKDAKEQGRERLRVLGNMATKLNIEGSVVHSYYTWVDPDMSKKDEDRYKLLTRNTGYNTGRSPMKMWEEDKIPNDFKLILDKMLSRRL